MFTNYSIMQRFEYYVPFRAMLAILSIMFCFGIMYRFENHVPLWLLYTLLSNMYLMKH